MKIQGIKAKSVRGIPRSWPVLPVGDKGVVIFGENGSGKSSFIDALEYALTGRSTLYSEDRTGVNWGIGSPHLVDGTPDIAILVSDGGRPAQVRFDTVPETLSQPGRDWLSSASRASFVLRRHMLLRFVSEQPHDRYELLEPFLSLERYKVIEDALRAWMNNLGTERLSLKGEIYRFTTTLRSVFSFPENAELDRVPILERINQELARLELARISETNNLQQAQARIESVLGDPGKSDRIAAIAVLKLQLQRLPTVESILPQLDGLTEAARSLEAEIGGRSERVITELLLTSRDVISASALNTCPVCEQAIHRDSLIMRLNERIDSDAKITSARLLKNDRGEVAARSVRRCRDALQGLSQEWQATLASPIPQEFVNLCNLLDGLLKALEAGRLRSGTLTEMRAQLVAASFSCDPHVAGLDDKLAAEGDGERRKVASATLALVKAATEDLPTLEAARNHHRKVVEQEAVVERLHGHTVSARKAGAQAMLDAVSDTANRYYAAIHPDEEIGESTLAVREATTSSVNLSTNFHGREEPPLLHFSESHLDTLGLCYFLALRKHEIAREPTYKVLVLDDVMHSVDAAHRSRVAQLLRREFSDHQLVITTHDDFFYDVMRQTFGAGFAYHRIANWTLSTGPILIDPKTDLDIVLDLAGHANRRPADLASACGRFLESYLKQIAERLNIAVPARFNRKADVGSLWPPIASKLLSRDAFASAHRETVTGLTANAWIRNACAAHHNEVASAVTAPEAGELALRISGLFYATHCDGCGWTIEKRDDENWSCNCGTLSYGR